MPLGSLDDFPRTRYKKTTMKRASLVLSLLVLFGLGCSVSSITQRIFATPAPPSTPTPTFTPTPLPTATPTITPTPAPPARLGVAEQWILIGDYAAALESYRSAERDAVEDETRAGALIGIGRVLSLQGEYDQARAALDDVIDNYASSPDLANAYYFRARLNEDSGDYAAAAADFHAFTLHRPGALDAYMLEAAGDNLVLAADYAGAITAYQAAAAAPRRTDPVFVQIKIGQAMASAGNNNDAVRQFMSIYDASNNDAIKAQADLLAGQVYLNMGLSEQGYARFQDAVNNYPNQSSSYAALSTLVESGIGVDSLNRAIVDYYAGQYGLTIDLLTRYLTATPEHDGAAHYYKGLALLSSDRFTDAVAEFDELISDHTGDPFFVDAFREKAYVQWAYLDKPELAAETLLGFVRLYPADEASAGILFEAARIQERAGWLPEAAQTWGRIIAEYPSAEDSMRALFLAGISLYRERDYAGAMTIFQRHLLLATSPADQSQAYFWIGKTATAQGNADAAQQAFEQSALRDPTGYYSERARGILQGKPILSPSTSFDLGYDLTRERAEAETWLRSTFALPPETVLSSYGEMGSDPRFQRANAYWELGLYTQARAEFEDLRESVTGDAVATYRLMNRALELGLYRTAIIAARQILTLANLDDAASLNAPAYFNHIRFGAYYKDMVLAAAAEEELNPLLLFSVIRQESLFEGFAGSTVGAQGLMQIMPATGQEMFNLTGTPKGYNSGDLLRPVVSIPMGALYLNRQRIYLNGDLLAGLAAYNGGAGNAQLWKEQSNGDPDLFVEIIRFAETRTYVMQIADFLNIYNRLYTRTP